MDEMFVRAACAATDRVVEQVRPEHYGLPTPCSQWRVRDLANHVLGTLALGRGLLSDTPPAVAMPPGGLPATDLVGPDLLAAYRSAAAALVAVTDAASIGRTHATPLGDMPGAGLAGFTAMDVLVHGWDLATAIGIDGTLEPSLAEAALGFAHQTINDEAGTRAPRIGAEVPVPPGADATARLVAFLGREP